MIDPKILEANRVVHRSLVNSGEYQKSPHFLPENKQRVKDKIANEVLTLLGEGSIKAIDFGCGTGFMIDILLDHAESVHGIDLTQEMLQRVDISSGRVNLHLGEAEKTPFPKGMFDVATAYSFLDHISDVNIFFREVYRVLRPGGVFFTGLNPNKFFAEFVGLAAKNDLEASRNNPLVNREILSMLDNGRFYEERYGIPSEILLCAESIKTNEGGFDANSLVASAKKAGLKPVRVSHEWFLGQAAYSNHANGEAIISEYLNKLMPASIPLFKYIDLIFVK